MDSKTMTGPTEQSAPWVLLESEEDWLQLDAKILGFHDGVIKEFHLSHGEFVNSSLEMVFEGAPVLWMLIQLQNPTVPTVELRFSNVSSVSFDSMKELEVTVSFQAGNVAFSFSQGHSPSVIAEKCEYRFGGMELLGHGPFCTPMDASID